MVKPMRIAHVSATFPPYQGGTGNVCYHHARELARRGHTVHVFTAGLPGAAVEQGAGWVVQRLRPWVQVGNAPLLPGLVAALRGFDLIHLHYPFIGGAELVCLAARRLRTPLLVSFHNDLIGTGARAWLFSLYQRCSARLVVRQAARLCAVSLDHYQASLLRRELRAGHPPVVELANGVDTQQFCPLPQSTLLRERYAIPPQVPLVLFVAALDRAHHFKGLERLLQAIALAPPDVWLLVVGDGELRAEYQRQAATLGIAERTVFAGAIDHQALPLFFRSADLTVLPSAPPESFGLVLIESLACGTPVIASDLPGVRTVVDHGNDGLLVPPGDVPALAAAILRMSGDATLRRAMGGRGRARVVARYDWTQIAARLEAIYREVLNDWCNAYSATGTA